MVFVTGDCHGEYNKFSTAAFPEQKEMTRDDIVIVCGDFGLWHNTNSEKHWHKWLGEKNFTVAFCDGNHENFDRLYNDFPVVEFHGGKAHKITDNIYHLMRGNIFDFEGKKFFVFGGASSHDIQDGILDEEDFSDHKSFLKEYNRKYYNNEYFRVNHVSWWKEELPSEEEKINGLRKLVEYNNKVDFVVSHCAPTSIVTHLGYGESDILTDFFETVIKMIDFKYWFFGHYHDNKEILGKYVLLYEQIVRVV